jgi:hypothetical protein
VTFTILANASPKVYANAFGLNVYTFVNDYGGYIIENVTPQKVESLHCANSQRAAPSVCATLFSAPLWVVPPRLRGLHAHLSEAELFNTAYLTGTPVEATVRFLGP